METKILHRKYVSSGHLFFQSPQYHLLYHLFATTFMLIHALCHFSCRSISVDRKPQEPYKRRTTVEPDRRKQASAVKESRESRERRLSPNKQTAMPQKPESRKTSPVGHAKRSTPTLGTVSGSSSGSEAWLTASGKSGTKGSGESTPLEELLAASEKRDRSFTRPGSAPSEERSSDLLSQQQRSMSLPKSFLSYEHG